MKIHANGKPVQKNKRLVYNWQEKEEGYVFPPWVTFCGKSFLDTREVLVWSQECPHTKELDKSKDAASTMEKLDESKDATVEELDESKEAASTVEELDESKEAVSTVENFTPKRTARALFRELAVAQCDDFDGQFVPGTKALWEQLKKQILSTLAEHNFDTTVIGSMALKKGRDRGSHTSLCKQHDGILHFS